jgi:exonuclease VII large subunit
VGKLKGYKEKLAQAGDLRRRLEEKEEESESLMEQLAEKEAEASLHQRQAEELKKETWELKKALQESQMLLQALQSAPGAGGVEGGDAPAGDDCGGTSQRILLSQLQDSQTELRATKTELQRARHELAAYVFMYGRRVYGGLCVFSLKMCSLTRLCSLTRMCSCMAGANWRPMRRMPTPTVQTRLRWGGTRAWRGWDHEAKSRI